MGRVVIYYMLPSALVPSDKSFPSKHIGQMRRKSLPSNVLSMNIAPDLPPKVVPTTELELPVF